MASVAAVAVALATCRVASRSRVGTCVPTPANWRLITQWARATKATRPTRATRATRGYMGLQAATSGYKGLQGVTRGYKGPHKRAQGYRITELQGYTAEREEKAKTSTTATRRRKRPDLLARWVFLAHIHTSSPSVTLNKTLPRTFLRHCCDTADFPSGSCRTATTPTSRSSHK